MGYREYIKEWWQELWNPDSRAWQITDRILFPTLPALSFILFAFKSYISQGWLDFMANLLWIIPLAVWLLYFLIAVPFRLVSKYKHNWIIAKTTIAELKSVKPIPNREALIRAMSDCRIEAIQFKAKSDKAFDKLVARARDNNLTQTETHETIHNITDGIMHALHELDTEILIAGKDYASVFEDFKSNMLLPLVYNGLLALSGQKIKYDSENIEYNLDQAISKAIDMMDSKSIEKKEWENEKQSNKIS